MPALANRVEDILASSTRRGLPRKISHPTSDIASYMKGVDNFCHVMVARPDRHDAAEIIDALHVGADIGSRVRDLPRQPAARG